MSSRNLSDLVSRLRDFFSNILSKAQRARFSYTQNRLDEKALAHTYKTKPVPSAQQIKHLPKVLTEKEQTILKNTSIIGVLALILFFYLSIFHSTSLVPKNGGEYTEGLVGSPLYINPVLAQTNDVDMDLQRLVFNGLVRYDENYNIVPDLAESWEISEDKKEYTFKIRDGVTWHDGEKFSVNDVFFTYQVIKDKTFKSPLNITFEGVTAEITGEGEITYFLEEQYAGFLNVVTHGILPQHLWFDVPSTNSQLAKFNQKPIGTGPYKFKSFIQERNGSIVSYTFEKNKEYHLDVPYIEKLMFKFYPDIRTAFDALKNKNVQGLGFLPKEYIDEVGKRSINLYNINLSQFTAVFFNAGKNDLLKDEEVKQALTLATNKDQIIEEIIQNQGNIIHGPVLPGFVGFDDQLVDEHDPAKAAEVLTADGWALQDVIINADGSISLPGEEEEADDEEVVEEETTTEEGEEGATEEVPVVEEEPVVTEQVLVKDETPLVITLTTVQQPDSVKLVELLKQNWERIGVKVNLNIVEKAEFATVTLPDRDYEALAYGGIIGYDADLFPFWHSSQREFPGVNLANYVNRKVDTLIEDVRKVDTVEEQEEKMKEIQSLMAEDRPAIFLYSPTYTYPVSSKVHGVNINRLNLPSDRFWTITQRFVKTKKFFK